MSDLTDELRHMAADGADKARPLGVAEIMRRGNRRRARTIGQRSLSGLSVLGVGAAIVMTGVLHPTHGAAGHPASGAAGTATTLTETAQSQAGTMTVGVKYRDKARGKIKVLSITFAGKSQAAKRHAFIFLAFGQFVSPVVSQEPVCPNAGPVGIGVPVRTNRAGVFAGSLPPRLIRTINGDRGLCGNQAMQVRLTRGGKKAWTVISGTIMTVGLELSR